MRGVRSVQVGEGVVGLDVCVVCSVCEDVDVGCAAGVVAWEYGLELHDAFFVAGLDSAQEGGVEVGRIVLVAVTTGLDAGVDTLDGLVSV